MGEKTRKHYTEAFKRDAVRLVAEEGRKVSEVARELGVNENMLHRWKSKYEGEAQAEGSGEELSKNEREELLRLRKENRRLKMERDILKKAAAFFARESDD